jgi:hypothetical protein
MQQLNALDSSNMHTIMGNEAAVLKLMEVIDSALKEADKLDTHLALIDRSLAVCWMDGVYIIYFIVTGCT